MSENKNILSLKNNEICFSSKKKYREVGEVLENFERDAEIQNTWLMRKGWKDWVLLTWNGKIRRGEVTVFKQRKCYCTKDSIQLCSVLYRLKFPWFWKPMVLFFCKWVYRWGQTIISFSESAMGNACSFQRHLLQHGETQMQGHCGWAGCGCLGLGSRAGHRARGGTHMHGGLGSQS